MSKVVVISGHPNLKESYANSLILEEIKSKLDGVSIHHLGTLYPDYQIDVEAEQNALKTADVIVLQFPFFWYSVPALLKKWLDDVMTFNFAYGPEGDKLKNKAFILSFTIGGPEESYDPLGYNHFPIEQLILPLQQTAYLAGMKFQKPIYTHRMIYIPNVYNELKDVQARARAHADRLIHNIYQITNSDESLIKRFVTEWFQSFDLLSAPESRFTGYMAENIQMTMPEGKFEGHDGFSLWYENIKRTFKPNCSHDIEQLTIKPSSTGYQIDLRIRLKAETYEDSLFKGKPIELNVNETWQLSINEDKQIQIHEYLVVPLDS